MAPRVDSSSVLNSLVRVGSSIRMECKKNFVCLAVLSFVMVLVECGGKKPVSTAAPPAAPPPSSPTISIAANPTLVQAGQSATITWTSENATEVRIEPLGPVETNGSKIVTPTESTSYRLIATGPGGTQESVTRITVAPAANAPPKSDDFFAEENGRQDVFFDVDQYSIRADQQGTIQNDARFLNKHPDLYVMIEGHCDELGSTDYNLALGDIRANEVKEALVKAGVDSARIDTVTYGKERPFCRESTENCWKQNRRAHIVPVER
jgi:peptidoglycan-associated lipoprotein